MSRYEEWRNAGMKCVAMSWEDIVWEAKRAIGTEDANAWLIGMADILANPFFVSTPQPWEFAVPGRAAKKFPHVLGHTWVSPHPEAFHKLGCYQVWSPDLKMHEIRGEDAVRAVLLENDMERAKL